MGSLEGVEAAPRCPCCGGRGARPRYRLSFGTVRECEACGNAFLERTDARTTVEANEEFSLSEWRRTRLFDLPFSRRRARARLRKLASGLNGGRILELGCGDGSFLHEARRAGHDVLGLDTQPNQLRANATAAVIGDACRLPFGRAFAAVAGFHVFEHVDEPRLFLRSVRDVLGPGGLLYLEVPNYGCLWRRLRGRRWADFYPYHPVLYSRRGLRRALGDQGFRVISIWARETGWDVLGHHYFGLRNALWGALARRGRHAGGEVGTSHGAAAAPPPEQPPTRLRLALYRCEGSLLRAVTGTVLALVTVPLSLLGLASRLSVIATVEAGGTP